MKLLTALFIFALASTSFATNYADTYSCSLSESTGMNYSSEIELEAGIEHKLGHRYTGHIEFLDNYYTTYMFVAAGEKNSFALVLSRHSDSLLTEEGLAYETISTFVYCRKTKSAFTVEISNPPLVLNPSQKIARTVTDSIVYSNYLVENDPKNIRVTKFFKDSQGEIARIEVIAEATNVDGKDLTCTVMLQKSEAGTFEEWTVDCK